MSAMTLEQAAEMVYGCRGFAQSRIIQTVVLFGHMAKTLTKNPGTVVYREPLPEDADPATTMRLSKFLVLENPESDIIRTLDYQDGAIELAIGWDWALGLFAHGVITWENWENAYEDLSGENPKIIIPGFEIGEHTITLEIENRVDPFYMAGQRS